MLFSLRCLSSASGLRPNLVKPKPIFLLSKGAQFYLYAAPVSLLGETRKRAPGEAWVVTKLHCGQASEPTFLKRERSVWTTSHAAWPAWLCRMPLWNTAYPFAAFLEANLLLSKHWAWDTLCGVGLPSSQAAVPPGQQRGGRASHQGGCCVWLALLRLLSLSVFRNGWGIIPPFQLPPLLSP